MNHIDEHTLELFVLRSAAIETRKSEIETHLRECAGCAALHQEMVNYYNEAEQIRDERAQTKTQALTVRSMLVKAHPFTTPLSEIPKTVPARVVLFIIHHPAVSSVGFIGLFAALLLMLTPKGLLKDTNPAYARAKDEFLVAYNKEGDVLWKKHIGPGYDWEELSADTITPRQPDVYLATIDVDGDGRREVIAIFGRWEGRHSRNAVYCYNADGSERWVYPVERDMTFGKETFTNDYQTAFLIVGSLSKGAPIEVFVVAQHDQYYPTVILRLNGSDGKLLGEYWHSGNYQQVGQADWDGDGVEELFFVGENNGFDLAALLVLDPRKISGHSPAPPAYTPQNVLAGSEKYYILFPRNDLKVVATHKRNRARSFRLSGDSSLSVWVHEEVGPPSTYPTIFQFISSMQCVGVVGSDPFVTLHKKLEAEGKLTRKLDATYYEELRRGVLYWDGDKFLNKPVMNRRYVEALKTLAKK